MSEKQYKVMVADDEYWVRENLRTIIDWDKYSLLFMEPAVDGKDVLDRMEKDCPDILITDINMPYINGVELMKFIKSRYPHVVTIVLSGYSDFEYVRESLLMGAVDYLLKPITQKALINVLAKAVDVISKKQKFAREQESIKGKLLHASSLLMDKELSMFIASDEYTISEEGSYNQLIEMEFDLHGFRLVLLKINNLPPRLKNGKKYKIGYLSYKIKNMIKDIINDKRVIVFNNIYVSNEFVIIADMDKNHLDRICDDLFGICEQLPGTSINIAISNQYFSIEKIRLAYNEALSAMMSRKYRESNSKIWIDDVKKISVRKLITPEHEKELIFAVQSKNKKQVRKIIFDKIGLKRYDEENWLYIEVKQTVERIANILTNTASDKSNKYSALEILTIENLVGLLDRALEKMDMEEVCSILEQIIDEVFGIVDLYGASESMKDIVRHVIKYIDENYFEELSLTTLSKLFHVESSYLSRVFKKQTGYNLMFYISKRRIEKAVELINQGNLSLTEISQFVGYDDYTYFYRVFKKVKNKSPSEYRDMQLAKKK